MLLITSLNPTANLKNFLFTLLTLNNHVFKSLKYLNLTKKFFNDLSNIYNNWPALPNLPSSSEIPKMLR